MDLKREPRTKVPESFPFPFQPYDIQQRFMRELYKTLDQGKVGIFESPTGTGKSLSLICGALTWLRKYEEEQRQQLEDILQGKVTVATSADCDSKILVKETTDEPDWLAEFDEKRAQAEKAAELKEEIERKLKYEERLRQLKNETRHKYSVKRKQTAESVTKDEDVEGSVSQPSGSIREDEDDDDLVVTEYHSDEEGAARRIGDDDDEDETENDDEPNITKIYYCSRTHSQLAQFVREVQKSPFGEDTKVVSLGSRQNLCINEAVKRLKSVSLMNDKCLEMQKNKKKDSQISETDDKPRKKRKVGSGSCPFYQNMTDFRDRVLIEVKDIEQLVGMGKETKTCPYYGTRYSVPLAQLVVLPYNTLLHRSTRQACGIKLEGNIIIIDEAHNLLETISNIHSIQITGMQLVKAHSQLNQYMERYKSRLKAKNLMYIKQILYILTCLIKCLGGKVGIAPHAQKTGPSNVKLMTINDFLFTNGMDNINLFKVQKYCERSEISKKLNGFVEKYQPSVEVKIEAKEPANQSATSKFLQEISKRPLAAAKNNAAPIVEVNERTDEEYQSWTSPLRQIEELLLALTNADKDGRVVSNRQELLSQSSIKFLLLNPAVHFSEIVEQCKAMVIAGGTMQPVSEFKQQLFSSAGVQADRLVEFSCGHVIPHDHLLPLVLCKGPTGVELDFTYQSRDLPNTMDELGRVLCNVCSVVPGGVVCFFPSYDYENQVHTYWTKSGVITRLSNRKKILREPKKASQLDFVLTEYKSCIERCLKSGQSGGITGALLLSVVGGKMSEGINFSDHLGRCVVMVGLPYPNVKSPELKEKMDYLNSTMSTSDGRQPGQVHYENLCMKAVNQSIGRAIRHRGDYATIVLLDHRYSRSNVHSKLPGWIRDKVQIMTKFGPAYATIRKFFVGKQQQVVE
ncbi:ATP-dependent DNA helicase DDX11-like isoform X2 [Ptychodera flava]|uniref:ATP-dependent DNA helicase DDX11-like isoform X2 n=1 Tax=Ptychodera flava TaxID=63121 RepID=UPI00396A4656